MATDEKKEDRLEKKKENRKNTLVAKENALVRECASKLREKECLAGKDHTDRPPIDPAEPYGDRHHKDDLVAAGGTVHPYGKVAIATV